MINTSLRYVTTRCLFGLWQMNWDSLCSTAALPILLMYQEQVKEALLIITCTQRCWSPYHACTSDIWCLCRFSSDNDIAKREPECIVRLQFGIPFLLLKALYLAWRSRTLMQHDLDLRFPLIPVLIENAWEWTVVLHGSKCEKSKKEKTSYRAWVCESTCLAICGIV